MQRFPARFLLILATLRVGGVLLFRSLTAPVPEGPVRIGSLCNAGETIPFLPIQNPGATPLQIAGWRIQDRQGGAALPTFTLAPNAVARLWSADAAHTTASPPPMIVGLDPSDVPIQDIAVGRPQPGWASDVALQAPGLFRPPVAPRFFHISCDPAL